MDIRFEEALAAIRASADAVGGIGTLGEHTLHAVLKYCFEPHADSTERKIGSYVADIVNEDGIIEIQTGNYGHMNKKLCDFLSVARVTVVFPLTHKKTILRNGRRTRSPLTGNFYDAFYELYKIKAHLSNPRLTLHLLLIDMEEHRVDVHNRSGKIRTDRIPLALYDELILSRPQDYAFFIPDELGETFTSADFTAATKARHPWSVLNVLESVGVIRRVGMDGRRILYTRYQVDTEL